MTDILQRLAFPFPPDEVEWRKGPGGTHLAYLDARAVRRRLNEVCGAGWSCRYPLVTDKFAVCEIAICIDGQWVTRSDGADPTDIEAVKGMMSSAFKRAAATWGVGEYLYEMPDNLRTPDEQRKATGRAYFNALKAEVFALETNEARRQWWEANHARVTVLPDKAIQAIYDLIEKREKAA